MPEAWPKIIESHLTSLKSGEGKLFDKVTKFFNGDPWTDASVGDSEAALLKTSTNFSFPIVETATSVLIPPHPQVSPKPRNPMNKDQIAATEGVVNYSFDEGQLRDELAVVVQNAVMYGRAPVKTTWDAETDLPVTRFLDVKNYFFDQTAQRYSDVRYEIEATLLSRSDMKKRISDGQYLPSVLENNNAARFPQWMQPNGKAEMDNLRNYQPWYLVWEVHDRESGRVKHFFPQETDPILDDELIFRPYDMLAFSYNGKNLNGVSEIGLILPNQEEYNWTETFLLNILRFGIPATLADSRIGTTDELTKYQMAPLGSIFPVKVPQNFKSVGDAFFQRPLPQYPPLANDMLARKREGISYVSAISDAQRGQTVGAKTATEMEFIKNQIRDKLGPRISKVEGLIERIAEKHLLLASKYMRTEKVVELTGAKGWATYSPWSLENVSARFKMQAYSPAATNKATQAELLRNIQPLVVGNPHVNQRRFTEELFSLMELPTDLVLSPEEVQANMAAMAPQPVGPTPAPVEPSTPLETT